MNSTILKELLDLGDTFEQQHPHEADRTTTRFLTWATSQTAVQPTDNQLAVLDMPKRYNDNLPELPVYIVQYLTKAYRFFRLYVKKACETTPLLTFDDYVSLVYLAERGSMTKTRLVEVTVNEKTSGMLVIQRLINRGFVTQSDNADDRRSRCITLTDSGMAILNAVQPAMNQACTLMVGDLSETEQTHLATLLKRLFTFHEPLFLYHHDESLDELLERVPAGKA
jgi:MarR family transcriptional regulator, lower aerobic nicotinate degradation pathway regulator